MGMKAETGRQTATRQTDCAIFAKPYILSSHVVLERLQVFHIHIIQAFTSLAMDGHSSLNGWKGLFTRLITPFSDSSTTLPEPAKQIPLKRSWTRKITYSAFEWKFWAVINEEIWADLHTTLCQQDISWLFVSMIIYFMLVTLITPQDFSLIKNDVFFRVFYELFDFFYQTIPFVQ